MKKSLLFLSLVIPFSAAARAAGALDKVLAATDGALSSAAREAADAQQPFTVPPPVSIADPRYSDTPAADYLPLKQRAVFEYEYTSSEFTGSKVIRVEYMSYSEADRTAQVNMVIFNRTKPRVVNYVMTSDASGVRSSDSPLYGPRLEIPFPLQYNSVWNEGPDRSRVAALNAKITVPAGTYNGCLKVLTRLSDGDAGAAVRYYAPGVGLVYEQINSEEKQETISLTSYELK